MIVDLITKDDVDKLLEKPAMTKEEFDKHMNDLIDGKIAELYANGSKVSRSDTLSEARGEHTLRYSKERYGDENHTSIAYFNGWSNISSLVRLAFNAKNVARIEDKKAANMMAKELSDIFFKYARFN